MQQQTPKPTIKRDEQILVVKRSALFAEVEPWHGMNATVFDTLFKTVEQHQEFHPRSLMEEDPTYKQIIPYLVFKHEDKYFLMQRQAKASEQRLKSKYSLGIGGHIRQEDLTNADIMGWAEREFDEEINYTGSYTVKPLGVLNDDSDPVGQVHIGFVLLVEGQSGDISIKSELKSGKLYSLEECEKFYPTMESWSQMVFDLLRAA